MIAVWGADGSHRAYRLRGVHPLEAAVAQRLAKIAYVSPCFEGLAEKKHVLRLDNYGAQTSSALSWFCQENGLQHLILCPVLVRQQLVGVLVLFYRQKPALTAKVVEEMQSAANVFLCAL